MLNWHMSKNLQIIIGLVLLLIVPLWLFVISPEIIKLPANISFKVDMVHTENNRFDINSSWTGKTIAISSSSIKSTLTTSNKSTLQSLFKVESLTGESLFELNQSFLVDRQTRHNLPGGTDTEGRSSILFPPNVSQKPLIFWPVEMGAPIALTYADNKIIQGLNTFHFFAKNSIIDDTQGYEFLPLVPEKYKVMSRVDTNIYVDPLTGTIIDYQDSGVSYYVDKDDNPIWDIAQWSNKFNDPTITDMIKEANSKGQLYLFVSRIVPFVLSILGLFFIVKGFLKKAKIKNLKKK
jgi:hypothetical protein